MTTPAKPREGVVAVLGGGITGLSAAYELGKLGLESVLLESEGRCGGKLLSLDCEGLALEAGPDSFLTSKPQALELIGELGLSGELLPTHPTDQTVSVYSGGRMRALPRGMAFGAPASLLSLWSSDILSLSGRLRASLEPLVPARREDSDESLAAFIRRRLGPEVLERIAGPVLSGIYAGDPEQLSLKSTFPHFHALERSGGLSKAGRHQAPEGRTLFMTLRGGMGGLAQRLEQRVSGRRLGCEVRALSRRGGSWRIQTAQGPLEAQAVICALPAWRLAGVLGDLDHELAAILGEIPFASTATVSLVFDKAALPRPLSGFGFIVPPCEGRLITAATFTSSKFPGRVPEDLALIRCFAGSSAKELPGVSDLVLAERVLKDLGEIMDLGAAKPRACRAVAWRRANPQYTLGHPTRLKRIDSCLKGHPGLFLAGSSFHGVGLSDCIASARRAAASAGEFLLTRGRVHHA